MNYFPQVPTIHLLELVDPGLLTELLLEGPGHLRLVGQGGPLLLEDPPGALRDGVLGGDGLDGVPGREGPEAVPVTGLAAEESGGVLLCCHHNTTDSLPRSQTGRPNTVRART